MKNKTLKRIGRALRRFFGVKGKWYLAVINLGLLLFLVYLLTYLLGKLFVPDDTVRKLIQEWVDGPLTKFAGLALGATAMTLLGIKRKEWKGVVTALGRTNVLTVLLLGNVFLAVKYAEVHHPCYGVQPASPDTVVVLFAEFENKGTGDWVNSWPNRLRIRMEDTIKKENVVFVELPADKPVRSPEEADIQSSCYGASMVVWGSQGNDFLEPNYSLYTALGSFDVEEPYLGDRGEGNDSTGILNLSSFRTLASNEGDSEYVLDLLLALLNWERGIPEAAYRFATKAIDAANTTGRSTALRSEYIYLLRAGIGFWLERTSESLADADMAISMAPQDATVVMAGGMIQFMLHQRDEGIDNISKAILIDPNNGERYWIRAQCFAFEYRWAEAIDDLSRAISHGYRTALVYDLRGVAQTFLDPLLLNPRPILEDYSEAIRLDPLYAPAYRGRGDVYYMYGDVANSNELLTSAYNDYAVYVALEPGNSAEVSSRMRAIQMRLGTPTG